MKTRSGPRAAPAKAPLQGSGSNQVLGWWVLIDPIKVCMDTLCHQHCQGPRQGPPAQPQPPGTRIQ